MLPSPRLQAYATRRRHASVPEVIALRQSLPGRTGPLMVVNDEPCVLSRAAVVPKSSVCGERRAETVDRAPLIGQPLREHGGWARLHWSTRTVGRPSGDLLHDRG